MTASHQMLQILSWRFDSPVLLVSWGTCWGNPQGNSSFGVDSLGLRERTRQKNEEERSNKSMGLRRTDREADKRHREIEKRERNGKMKRHTVRETWRRRR